MGARRCLTLKIIYVSRNPDVLAVFPRTPRGTVAQRRTRRRQTTRWSCTRPSWFGRETGWTDFFSSSPLMGEVIHTTDVSGMAKGHLGTNAQFLVILKARYHRGSMARILITYKSPTQIAVRLLKYYNIPSSK